MPCGKTQNTEAWIEDIHGTVHVATSSLAPRPLWLAIILVVALAGVCLPLAVRRLDRCHPLTQLPERLQDRDRSLEVEHLFLQLTIDALDTCSCD